MNGIDPDAPRGRFVNAPRPLDFIRIRLFSAAQADWLIAICRDEADRLVEDLAALRRDGKSENGEDIRSLVEDARHCSSILRETMNARLELVGPDYIASGR